MGEGEDLVVVGPATIGATTCSPREPVVCTNAVNPSSSNSFRSLRAVARTVAKTPAVSGGSRSKMTRSGWRSPSAWDSQEWNVIVPWLAR